SGNATDRTGAGAICGIAAMAYLLPQHGMIDYPTLDRVLRSCAPIAMGTVFLSAGLAAAYATVARRRGALLPFISGIVFTVLMTSVLIIWMYAEAKESDVERTDITSNQELLAAALHASIDDRISAAAQLAARSSAAPDDAWAAAARTYVVDFRGTIAVALQSTNGEIVLGSTVPPDQDHELGTSLGSIAAPAASGDRVMATIGSDIAMATPAAGGRVLIALVDSKVIVQLISAGLTPELALTVRTGAAGSTRITVGEPAYGHPVVDLPPATVFSTAGLEWTVELHPTREWINSHHHRANTIILVLGAIASLACALAIRAVSTEMRARVSREFAERAAQGAVARARISAHARDAISQEASHVIRARIRETARALDAATDPRGNDVSRTEALQRIGASLTHAETEVAALLESTPQTRVARAEKTAEIDHHYASAVLEFPGGPTVPLSEPVSAEDIAQIQRELGSSTFAIITSDNPMSIPCSAHANVLRRSVLALELRNANLVHRPVIGRSADGKWSENGFAIAASIGEADALSEIHAQRAYYWFNGSFFFIHGMTPEHAAIRLPRSQSELPEK
ncbi:MAG: DUF3293 domain-containing protein, partial [Planctomycetota bacterium]